VGARAIRNVNFIILSTIQAQATIERYVGQVDFCNMQINWARHSWRLSVNCKLKFQITRC